MVGLLIYLVKNSYELLIQYIRLFQFIGLAGTLAYPLSVDAYYLHKGISYFNLRFVPNIYGLVVP
jgi:hypothetical protein